MKGILIDPKEQTIQEVEFDGSLHSFYELMNCNIVEQVRYDPKHVIVIDEEGIFKPEHYIFKVWQDSSVKSAYWYDGIIIGKAIIVGVEVNPKDGDLHWVSHNLDPSKVRIRFVGKEE